MEKYQSDPYSPSINQHILCRAITKLENEHTGIFKTTNTKSKSSLLDRKNKEFLQQTIVLSRDEANNGITRNKIFAFIQMLVGCDRK